MKKSAQQRHIDKIRREKFSLDENGQRIAKSGLADDLQRAIELLSEGLYHKETHFILELIQNAEDNRYPTDAKPDLAFHLLVDDPTETPGADGALVILNNETGFREDDVGALCKVGGTTKTKAEGYIGEKGIGFKSVFVVSSRPHLFSAGYQFYFQEQPDPEVGVGYIVPYWTQAPPALAPYRVATHIVLPLKAGKRDAIAEQLLQIAPETILFLAKLEQLTIHVDDASTLSVVRDAGQRPLVGLLYGNEYMEYWVEEMDFPVPSDLLEEKRAGITSRKVTVALPLSDAARAACDGQVHAFLPTEVDSGFQFLVNADFILTTNREAIQVDRPWNRWLRDCIAEVFVEAFLALLDHPDHRYDVYGFIPLADEVDDPFFRPVVEQIHQRLSELPAVLSAHGPERVRGEYSRLVPAIFRDLIDAANGTPQHLLAVPMVHARIQQYRKELEAIGARRYQDKDVLNCLRDDAWLDCQSPQWFARLYQYLSGQKSWATPTVLGEFSLILVGEGRRVNGGRVPVYFPLEGESQAWVLPDAPNFFTVAFVDDSLHTAVLEDATVNQWMIDTLQVREFNQANYYVDLAHALGRNFHKVQAALLVEVTNQLCTGFSYWLDNQQAIIREHLPLLLDDGTVTARERGRTYVIPRALDPETGWHLVFPESHEQMHLRVLADSYLPEDLRVTGDSAPNSYVAYLRERWQRFFTQLGIVDAPPPAQYTIEYDDYRYVRAMIPSHNRDDVTFPRSTRAYQYTDWRAPTWLVDLARAGQAAVAEETVTRRAMALLRWLERIAEGKHVWQSFPFGEAALKYFYYTPYRTPYPSEFQHYLKNAAWFPSSKGVVQPRQVFADNVDLREIFGDTVPYAPKSLGPVVANWLGIPSAATVQDLLEKLIEASGQPPEQANPELVQTVYTQLAGRQSELTSWGFESYPLILSQKPRPRWVTSREAIWPDLSAVFDETYVYLEPQYPRALRSFFVDKLGIAEQSEPKLYADAVNRLASQEAPAPAKVEPALAKIYPQLLAAAAEQAPWWPDFKRDAQVWTKTGRFVKPIPSLPSVVVPDDGDIAKIAADHIALAWMPPGGSLTEYLPLFEALGVPVLSKIAKASASAPDASPLRRTYPWLSDSAKRAVCAFLWNNHRGSYQQGKSNGLLESFLRTREVEVAALNVTYSIGRYEVLSPDSRAFWDADQAVLYVSSKALDDDIQIEAAAILARRLNPTRADATEDFFDRILGQSDRKVQALLRKKNWQLPDEEGRWVESVLSQPTLFDKAPESALSDSDDAEDDSDDLTSEETWLEDEEPSVRAAPDAVMRGLQDAADELAGSGQGTTRQTPAGMSGESSGAPARLTPPISAGRRTRLRSYLEPADVWGADDEGEIDGGSEHLERNAIDQAGIQYVLDAEMEAGRDPIELGHSHEGWDINSYDDDRLVRRIEVKSTKYAWDGWGIGLTAPQFQAAQAYRIDYYLYVVEHALEPERTRLYIIQDPAGKVADFRFDDKWKTIAYEP